MSDRRMRRVWKILYSRKHHNHKATDEFLRPAIVTSTVATQRKRQQADDLRKKGGETNRLKANLLEAEAVAEEALPRIEPDVSWSAQDQGAQRFLAKAFLLATDIKPFYASDLRSISERLQEIIDGLRKQSAALSSLGMEDEHDQLCQIVRTCEEQLLALKHPDDLDEEIIVTRDQGNVAERVYIHRLSRVTHSIFGSYLLNTLATVANVVFGGDKITAVMVREWLRKPSRSSQSNDCG